MHPNSIPLQPEAQLVDEIISPRLQQGVAATSRQADLGVYRRTRGVFGVFARKRVWVDVLVGFEVPTTHDLLDTPPRKSCR